jgi:hypothetical protein
VASAVGALPIGMFGLAILLLDRVAAGGVAATGALVALRIR